MAARSLDFHREATKEIRSAIAWYLQQSPNAADGFMAELNERIDAVLADPDRFAKYLYRTRHARLQQYPYLVVYKVRGPVVQIVSIAHTSRRPGYWAKRRFE